jgi:hypothetical protein
MSALRGHVDAVTSCGYVEGWALNHDAPLDPLLVYVEDETGETVARGRAHRYRDDLYAAGLGTGWNAFRLRASRPITRLRRSTLVLKLGSNGAELHTNPRPLFREDSESPLTTVNEVITSDPTVITNLDCLTGCASVFDMYIRARGVDAFIRSAYVYVLGRPVDPEGLVLYGRLIRQAALTPYALLIILSDSDEFRSRSRLLSAPPTPGFPFRC